MKDEIIIFTDGSSRGNPGPGGWGAIVVLTDFVSELGGREAYTTNNRMELMAAIGALEYLSSKKSETLSSTISIYTDSRYVKDGITSWIYGWQKKGWINSQKEEVLNRDLWERLFELTQGKKIEWNVIRGHEGIPANERCDQIATGFADTTPPHLYKGTREGYTVSLQVKDGNSDIKSSSKKKSAKGKGYSYISLVDGKIMIHKTWEDCKVRVSGKSGAKYKKAMTPADEADILKEWA